jgi:GTP-binding protein YchF
MALSIGIVGLPNVGKSTLFYALTKKEVERGSYAFSTTEPNMGVVTVPDNRVDQLADLCHSKKRVYTTIEFVDVPGLVEGSSQGEGLGNKFLTSIRQADAIIFILRAFINEGVLLSGPCIDPLWEREILETEILLKDLEIVGRRAETLEKEGKAGKKGQKAEWEAIAKAHRLLQEGKPLVESAWSEEEKKLLRGYQLLSLKPRLYLLNCTVQGVAPETLQVFREKGWPFMALDALTAADSAEFTREERIELGLDGESEVDLLIRHSYQLLDLITFLTTGPDETRAWTLRRGMNAQQAGGAIHTDLEKHFIRAQVIPWQELLKAGSFAQARDKGLVRTEGKTYLVQDGDVVEILHNA